MGFTSMRLDPPVSIVSTLLVKIRMCPESVTRISRTKYHALRERTRHSQVGRSGQVAHYKGNIFYQPMTGRVVDRSRIQITIHLIRIDITKVDFGYVVATRLWNEVNGKDWLRQLRHEPFHEGRLRRLSYINTMSKFFIWKLLRETYPC